MPDTMQNTLDTAVQDDPVNGVYRVGRDIFTDPEIFELEMKHIFERNWIYLALRTQHNSSELKFFCHPAPPFSRSTSQTDQSARPASSGPVVLAPSALRLQVRSGEQAGMAHLRATETPTTG